MKIFQRGSKTHKLKKLQPRYMRLYPIVERLGAVAYRLQLTAELSLFHDVFQVSVWRKVMREPEFILQQPPSAPGKKKVYAPCQLVDNINWQVKEFMG